MVCHKQGRRIYTTERANGREKYVDRVELGWKFPQGLYAGFALAAYGMHGSA